MTGEHSRIGCDVVHVPTIESAIAAFGDRYLARVYTALERRQTSLEPERIAARFAGKEAVIKLLRPERDSSIPYTDIEIAVLPSGAPLVRLAGRAQLRAVQQGLSSFAISLSHDSGTAFATALCSARSHIARKETQMTSNAIRDILARYGGLRVEVSTLLDTDDLYEAGLSSHSSINVMLALEDELGITFPDDVLTKSTFASVAAISVTIESLAGVSS